MTKVSVVGGGNAGCITALYLSWYKKELEVELIYNPDVPCERVGQASVLDPPKLYGLLLDLIGITIPFMLHLKVVYYMKDGVNIMKNYFMDSLLIVWQCIIVLGRCRNMF